MTPDAASNPADGRFAATQWSLVLRARDGSPESRLALSELCGAYYAPVLRFMRARIQREDEARELTQEFFAGLLQRAGLGQVERDQGRFRSYLLGAVKNFLAMRHRHAVAAKRGGGVSPVPMDAAGPDGDLLQVPDPHAKIADAHFDRAWAATLVDRAVAALAAEYAAAGKAAFFDALKPWLLGSLAAPDQAELAGQLGLTEGALKVALHRLRKRMRDQVKAQIAQTVESEAEIREEMQYLIEVLAQSPVAPS